MKSNHLTQDETAEEDTPLWLCPVCKMYFFQCMCGSTGGGDEDEERGDRDTGEDLPSNTPGYDCPRPGTPVDPVHIQ